MALVASRSYVKQTKNRNEVFGFTAPLFSSQLEMLCERGFPILRRINSILGFFRDAGIMSKLKNDFQYNSTILIAIKELVNTLNRTDDLNIDNLDEIRNDEENETGPNALKPEQIFGAITILLLGLSTSLLIFAFENFMGTVFFKNIRSKVYPLMMKHKLSFKNKIFTFSEIFTLNINLLKNFDFLGRNSNKEVKNKSKLQRRRVRTFAYRRIKFTPKGHCLVKKNKVI